MVCEKKKEIIRYHRTGKINCPDFGYSTSIFEKGAIFMHTVWKGAISFGLVNVPVKMFTATESSDISLRMLHKNDFSPIQYKKTCAECNGKEVSMEEIVKGYEYEPGKFVTFEKDELEQLADEASKEIKIVDFVDLSEIDPIYFQKTYYLAPNETGTNAYLLLREALKETGKIGIANVTLRSKGSLAAIRVIDHCLAMVTMYYPEEIRSVDLVPNVPKEVTVNEKELQMAKMLIEQLTTHFEPQKFENEYRKKLLSAIEKKVAGQEIVTAPTPQRPNVINLMEALQASIEQAKKAEEREKPIKPPRKYTRKKKEVPVS